MNVEKRVQRDVEALAAAIGTTRDAVATGANVDLAPLQARADALCTLSAEIAPGGGAEIKPVLIGLIDEFERLAVALRDRHRDLEAEMGGSRNRRDAHAAYHRTPRGSR